CCPYRGSLLTSRYPHEMIPGHEYGMPAGTPTVANPFNDAGYHTAYIGKWHVDGWHERDGRGALHTIPSQRRGSFKQWLGFENNNSQWDCFVHGHDDKGNQIPHYRLPTYETDALTDLTLDYINERKQDDQPFFCVLSVQPPHNPYVCPEEFQGRHTPGNVQFRDNVPEVASVREKASKDLAGYYGMIENLDHNLGRVRDLLWDLDMIEDTHIIFFSDHGDMHGSHGQYLKTCPYEESVRVPMIFGGTNPHYGGNTGVTPALVNHVDMAPTSLGLCDITPPDWMRGTDYSALRVIGKEKTQYPDSAFLQLVVPTGHGNSTDRPWRGVVTTDGWKYICLEHQPWLMFNLNEDPYEQVNLAHNSGFKQQRQKLQDQLAKWIKDTGDTFPLPTDI
ncbi:MAG: sulfatase-like hydrolase/transferase, partial [Phycisphaeraceae bacterium]|nr:sulfatase-like hydrolase/transferase [Phycisphaeraceae bacterium]